MAPNGEPYGRSSALAGQQSTSALPQPKQNQATARKVVITRFPARRSCRTRLTQHNARRRMKTEDVPVETSGEAQK